MNSKQKFYAYLTSSILFLLLFFVGIILLLKKSSNNLLVAISFIILSVSSVLVGISAISAIKNYLKNQAVIKNSFNYYIDDIVSQNAIGVIVFNNQNKILWTSSFIKNRFGRNWIGKDLNSFFKELNVTFEDSNNLAFDFNHKGFSYNVNIWGMHNSICIKDTTLEKKTLNLYQNESTVLGEIEIDNFPLYQSILSEDQLFNVNKAVIEVLDNLVANYNFVYRQYNTNGKFIVITNKKTIEDMSKTDFSFFKKIHEALKLTKNNVVISISAGFALGSKSLQEKMGLAKQALLHAQNRGGDQVVIFADNQETKYYGSTIEILPNIDRTRVKSLARIIEKKLLDRQIENVIIYGHKNADLDAIGSAMGLYALAKTYGKKAFICTASQDETTKRAIAKNFSLDDEMFIKPHQANKITNDNTLVFLTDTSYPERTDNPECISKVKIDNIFIIDHHRLTSSIDFCPKTNRLIDPSASSASEIVTEVIIFVSKNISLETKIAQMLLNGIYLDTLQFQKNVSSKTFEISSWLESKGANSSVSNETLKIDFDTYHKINLMLENLQEVKPGFYLAYRDIPLSNDIISIVADEILRISGRKASFVVARNENNNSYKLSARGINTNVQIIAEAVGGGGHFSSAAAVSNEDLPTFIDNIKQAIVSAKNENNTN